MLWTLAAFIAVLLLFAISKRKLGETAIRERLRGRVVVVTGASSGLGRALARACYNAGCVIIAAARNETALAELSKELDGNVHVFPLDVSDFEGVELRAKALLNSHGHVDVLINNAGVSSRSSVLETSLDVDQNIMNVNYFGAVALTRALLPSMIQKGKGHVVAISSVQGKLALPFRSSYSAAKHAMQAFFTSLRAEVSHLGIDVTVVSPGYIKTSLSANALRGDGSKHKTTDPTTENGMSPERVASEILEAIASKKPELTVSDVTAKMGIYIQTLAPAIMRKLMARRAQKHERDHSKTS
ncbi:dehydrogenase/reductase SDR family member 7B-like [Oscarella lobularis]|uniref:dehydrogenase/reductase SDR family member 7B-like n=1 Tax=Oscarella lobularis TaxID=121494 RepID=UPI0033135BF9